MLLKKGIISTDFKFGKVTPVFKSGSRQETNAALTVYKTMLIPLLTYCSILTGNPSKHSRQGFTIWKI